MAGIRLLRPSLGVIKKEITKNGVVVKCTAIGVV